IVELFQIDDVIPWWLFETVDGKLNFESLDGLRLEFIHEAEHTVDGLERDVPVQFPKLSKLHVTNSSYIYANIFDYFKDRDLERLAIRDDPRNFNKIKKPSLERAKVLTIGYPTGTSFVDTYSVKMTEHLYSLPSNAEEAVIGRFQYAMPKMIAWANLRKLRMSASIADKHGLTNLLAQLPLLEMLFMDCFSMLKDDAALTNFPDQRAMLDRLGQVMDPEDRSIVSDTLTHMEFFVYGNYDLHGLCELLSRLSNVYYVKVNNNVLSHVMYTLEHIFGVIRPILFESFPQ
ncbi:hypothetical protein FBU59_000176, partial [Linderina macrospora]